MHREPVVDPRVGLCKVDPDSGQQNAHPNVHADAHAVRQQIARVVHKVAARQRDRLGPGMRPVRDASLARVLSSGSRFQRFRGGSSCGQRGRRDRYAHAAVELPRVSERPHIAQRDRLLLRVLLCDVAAHIVDAAVLGCCVVHGDLGREEVVIDQGDHVVRRIGA